MRGRLALTALLFACGRGSDTTDAAVTTYVPPIPAGAHTSVFRRIGKGSSSLALQSGIKDARRQVIRDSDTWKQVWSEIFSQQTPLPELPDIDFDNEMVVLAAIGTRPTGGYGVQVQDAFVGDDGTLFAGVVSSMPGKNCALSQIVTQPVDAAVADKAANVQFMERSTTANCH